MMLVLLRHFGGGIWPRMQDGYHLILNFSTLLCCTFFGGLVGGSRYGYLSDYGWHAAFGLILNEQ